MKPFLRTMICLTAMLAVSAFAQAAWACPSCQAALAGDSSQGNLVTGLFWSILFMMSMPFAILGVFCGSMYVAVRRARAEKDQQQAPETEREPQSV